MREKRRRGRRNRGSGLATTLVVVSVVILLGFTVAGISFSHLNVSTRMSNTQVARNRAESAIASALDDVIQAYEAGGPAFQGRVDIVPAPNEPKGGGTVCFDAAQLSNSPPLPASCLSTNNIGNDNDVSAANGSSRVIPGDGIHLIAVGTSGKVVKRIEAVVYVPRFPYAIAGSGPITSPTGGLLVASLKDPSRLLTMTFNAIRSQYPEEIQDGHIASNSNSSSAFDLNGTNLVTGDLRAVGNVTLGAQTVVEGEVRTGTDRVGIPDLDVNSYDTAGKPGLVNITGFQSGTVTIDRWARSDGDLTADNGIELKSGVLFVDGNLTVNAGGVKGKGAIIATGTITIKGSGAFTTDKNAAIIGQNGISITDGAPNSQLQGLVYTEGDLVARDTTLVGALVANAQDADGSQMTLENFNLIQAPEVSESQFVVGSEISGGTGPDINPPSTSWQPGINPAAGWRQGGTYGPTGTSWRYKLEPVINPVDPSLFGTTPPYTMPNTATLTSKATWRVHLEQRVLPAPGIWGPPPAPQTPYFNLPSGLDQAALQAAIVNELVARTPGSSTTHFEGPPATGVATSITTGILEGLATFQPDHQQVLDEMNAYNQPITSWGPQGGGGGPQDLGTWSLDINDSSFIDLKDKLRVLYWRDM